MPAFVDSHVCLVQARPNARSIERLNDFYDNPDPDAFQDILKDGAHSCASLSSQTLKQRAARLASGLLRHGTGTVLSRAPYALDSVTAMKILRIQREPIGALQTISSLLLKLPSGENPVQWTAHVCNELLPQVKQRRLAAAIDLAADSHYLSESEALRILSAAAQLGFISNVDADLFAPASAALAIKANAVSVAGFRDVTRAEILSLAASSTIATFKPGVTFQTGMHLKIPARAMLDAGVVPGLASGCHPELSPASSMQMILLLASRLYRFAPEEAITAATINNAYALRLEASVGSIETGKQADVVVLNVSDYRELAYYAGTNVVEKVFKHGMLVYDSRSDSSSSKFEHASGAH